MAAAVEKFKADTKDEQDNQSLVTAQCSKSSFQHGIRENLKLSHMAPPLPRSEL